MKYRINTTLGIFQPIEESEEDTLVIGTIEVPYKFKEEKSDWGPIVYNSNVTFGDTTEYLSIDNSLGHYTIVSSYDNIDELNRLLAEAIRNEG